ncbi:MAG: hypothetical protein KAG53_06040 [Endozoicomonadaceae bacterium]|nr:hypothetical protein [Endozoicomonadaceae bacterium]
MNELAEMFISEQPNVTSEQKGMIKERADRLAITGVFSAEIPPNKGLKGAFTHCAKCHRITSKDTLKKYMSGQEDLADKFHAVQCVQADETLHSVRYTAWETEKASFTGAATGEPAERRAPISLERADFSANPDDVRPPIFLENLLVSGEAGHNYLAIAEELEPRHEQRYNNITLKDLGVDKKHLLTSDLASNLASDHGFVTRKIACPKFCRLTVRAHTFEESKIEPEQIDKMLKSGFFHSTDRHSRIASIVCFLCKGGIEDKVFKKLGFIPDHEHAKLYPGCPFIQKRMTSDNIVDAFMNGEQRKAMASKAETASWKDEKIKAVLTDFISKLNPIRMKFLPADVADYINEEEKKEKHAQDHASCFETSALLGAIGGCDDNTSGVTAQTEICEASSSQLGEANMCPICRANEVTYVLYPCRHTLCDECVFDALVCPFRCNIIARGTIEHAKANKIIYYG